MEWLEWLVYGAESHRKVVSSRLGFAIRQPEYSVNPAVNGNFIELGKDKAAKGEGLAPPFNSCNQDTMGL